MTARLWTPRIPRRKLGYEAAEQSEQGGKAAAVPSMAPIMAMRILAGIPTCRRTRKARSGLRTVSGTAASAISARALSPR